ncbi:hypothetical protein [Saccharothrix australiensis]|uniref:Uncharacterized protein n=1 Tax=Saccharothrix australiensis TaxID=2072 RepID=A0A495VZ44_9PSEU|nr:hypothetical protein [Saccharothrix australiensis]RKT53645.1 hypothetical protein C8E97_2219 [Saccharothrix australiensis]
MRLLSYQWSDASSSCWWSVSSGIAARVASRCSRTGRERDGRSRRSDRYTVRTIDRKPTGRGRLTW